MILERSSLPRQQPAIHLKMTNQTKTSFIVHRDLWIRAGERGHEAGAVRAGERGSEAGVVRAGDRDPEAGAVQLNQTHPWAPHTLSHSKLVHRRCLIWQQDQSRKEGIQRSVGLLKKTCFQAYKPKRGKWTLLYTYKSRVIFFLQWRQRKYKPRTVSTGQEAKRKSQQRTEGETNERGKGKRSKKEKKGK